MPPSLPPGCLLVPDLAAALARGSAHLGLAAPADLDEALALVLAVAGELPGSGPEPRYLGPLDRLLEPFVAGLDDEALDTRLAAFWQAAARLDGTPHADLGPDDGRVVRALLRVDRRLRRPAPTLALRVDPRRTPDDLLRDAVRTACADGKPQWVNHPMAVADHGERHAVLGCVATLPLGGGALAAVPLDLAAAVRAAASADDVDGAVDRHVDRAVATLVPAAREALARLEDHWLLREGLIGADRFTAVVGVHGVAEAVQELLARDGVRAPDGGPARYGPDPAASDRAGDLLARVAARVAATPVPGCTATGGHPVVQAWAASPETSPGTAGGAVPEVSRPSLYRHLRALVPAQRHLLGGVADTVTVEPVVEHNPDAVVAVLRGAFAEGVRELAVDVAGNGFSRVTGYLRRERDIAALRAAAAEQVAAILRAAPQDRAAVRAALHAGEPARAGEAARG